MRPPPERYDVPTARNPASKRLPPKFYHHQPQWTTAPLDKFKKDVPQMLSPMQCIPQKPQSSMSLPLKDVLSFQSKMNMRGDSAFFDKSTVAARPLRGFPSGLGFEADQRKGLTKRGVKTVNWDPAQKRAPMVKSY